MKRNLLKSIIILLTLTFVTLQSCEKKTLTDTENGIAKKEIVTADKKAETIENYIFKGKNISKNDIDFNSEHLTLIYGYDKNIYVFYSDDELYKWAVSKGLKKMAQSVLDIQKARKYAVETGEILKDKPSPEFEKYMNDNFSTGEKSGGIMYQNFYFGGWSNYMFPVPKARLKSKYDNGLSSFKSFVNSYRLFDKKWWKGTSWVFITVVWNQWETLPADIDDKTSSYWAF